MIRLVDINGNVAASYRYDPYGKATSALGSHANINPLRYRGYVFDHETGLYYLQSRYYDPEIGRFINADGLVSTGQGLLNNNMFAYCLNNPLSYIDPLGTLAFPGEIHNEVVKRIARRYGLFSEQIIIYDHCADPRGKKYGRADLVSPTGQVWEVKRDRARQINAGKKQVEQYVKNTWKNGDASLSIGGNIIAPGSFTYKSGLTTYRVTYRYAGDGVIAYDYSVIDVDVEPVLNTALVVSMAIAASLVVSVAVKGAVAAVAFA